MTTEGRAEPTPVGRATIYRWPRARLIRPVGRVVVGLGLAWIAVTLLVAGMHATSWWFVGLGTITIMVVVGVGLLVLRPPAVLELTHESYRLHNLRGGGTPAARWTDVDDVTTGESVAGPVLVLEGHGRAPSVVPLVLLGPRSDEAQHQVRALLQAAHRNRAS